MSFDPQFILVAAAFLVAAVYTARSFRRQFDRPDDEAPGCANCPAADAGAGTGRNKPA